jgi:acetyl-CoA C-acetyltransferase
MRSEPTMFAGKDHINPRTGVEAAAAFRWQGGITDPLNEIESRRDLRPGLLV